jgi:molecular chaperone DnaK (HSP70)
LFNHNQYDGRPYDDFGYFGPPNNVTIDITSAFEPEKHSTQLPINVAIELSDTNLIPLLTKGVILPASRTEIISTAHSGFDTCVFSIWSLVSDKRSIIGKFQLEGLPVVFGGLAWVELTILVDDDKLLHVFVRVMSGGR